MKELKYFPISFIVILVLFMIFSIVTMWNSFEFLDLFWNKYAFQIIGVTVLLAAFLESFVFKLRSKRLSSNLIKLQTTVALKSRELVISETPNILAIIVIPSLFIVLAGSYKGRTILLLIFLASLALLAMYLTVKMRQLSISPEIKISLIQSKIEKEDSKTQHLVLKNIISSFSIVAYFLTLLGALMLFGVEYANGTI